MADVESSTDNGKFAIEDLTHDQSEWLKSHLKLGYSSGDLLFGSDCKPPLSPQQIDEIFTYLVNGNIRKISPEMAIAATGALFGQLIVETLPAEWKFVKNQNVEGIPSSTFAVVNKKPGWMLYPLDQVNLNCRRAVDSNPILRMVKRQSKWDSGFIVRFYGGAQRMHELFVKQAEKDRLSKLDVNKNDQSSS